jgi:hypothetical protein
MQKVIIMKKILLVVVSLIAFSGFCQKKKSVKNPATTTSILAKSENLTAELVKNNFYLFINTIGTKKDTILLKTFEGKNIPLDTKIVTFTAKNTQLYAVSWIEKTTTATKFKTEVATTTFTEVCELTSKSKVLSNAQTTTTIKEIHFLDTKQTVSETIEKLRKEGFEVIIATDGSIILKNKTQETKLQYNSEAKKFTSILTSKKK